MEQFTGLQMLRAGRLTRAGVLFACLAASVFMFSSAGRVEAVTTSCDITVNGSPIATSGDGAGPPDPNPTPVSVPVDEEVEILLVATGDPVDLRLALQFGPLPIPLPSDWTPTAGVHRFSINEFALYGAGLYNVAGSIDECHFSTWVKVEGGPPLTVPAIVAAAVVVIGVTAAASGFWRGVRRVGRAGLVRSIAGGAVAGAGAFVVAQQAGMVPLEPLNLGAWMAVPGGGAGLAHVAFAGMARADGRDRWSRRELEDGSPEPEGAGRDHAAPPPRWLSAIVRDETGQVLERAFRADAVNSVSIDIGPLREQVGRLTARGEESIDVSLAPGRPHQLVIVFEIRDLQIFGTQPLTLPPTGASEPVVFAFRAPGSGSPIGARISALYANRVLQTAELRGLTLDDPRAAPAGIALEFRLAAVRPGLADLQFRRPFDAAVLAGHLSDGRAVATSVADLAVAYFDDEDLTDSSSRIIGLLTDLADHPERFAEGLESVAAVNLLRHLALEGRALHDVLGRQLVEQLPGAALSRLQVVSDAEDFIPLEFIYDGPVPALDAGLCRNWRVALAEGTCLPANHPVDEVTGLSSVVCPSHFWAMTKVVERHVAADHRSRVELSEADFAIVAGPSRDRPHLRAFESALFAASGKVRAEDAQAILDALGQVTAGRSWRASTWRDWIARVASDEPALLVLLSHSTRSGGAIALEIEEAEQFPLVAITNSFVSANPDRPPVVLLLGCETATADKDLQSFVGRIKENGAALVVGTIAPVLGRHAAPVAKALIAGLDAAGAHAATADRAAADAAPGSFGDVMLRLRRTLLADGHLMALCITSFGDADWQLASGASPTTGRSAAGGEQVDPISG